MIGNDTIEYLIALAHEAQAASATLAEAIEVAAERGGVSKSALRRVVMAHVNDKLANLEREATAVLAMIDQDEMLDDDAGVSPGLVCGVSSRAVEEGPI